MKGSRAPAFLLEIGCEELPDWMIAPALRFLNSEVRSLLEKERLHADLAGSDRLLGTPRRLAVSVGGLSPRQEDREVEVVGPRLEAAFDSTGKPTRALEGFARAQQVAIPDLIRVDTPKGRCIAARRRQKGEEAREVLASALPSIITSIPFGKTMRWGEGEFRFARPLHWIVCLLGSEIVPFELAGITSGRTSRGTRFDGSPELEIPDASAYQDLLRGASVFVDTEERRTRIVASLAEECSRLGSGFRIEERPELVKTVNGMVEHPVASAGAFDAAFLPLPAPVLVTAMIHHQRFFPVRAPDGSLAPHFVAVLNCRAEPGTVQTIRRGNEWVLRARLRDAAFFWQEDRKRKLEERLLDLEKVLFEATLGSYRQKVRRLESLTRQLSRTLGESGGRVDPEAISEAARLSKADLTTLMVKEFPELQGIMGGLYARQEGKSEEVCAALEQQYRGGSGSGSRERFTTGEAAALAVVDRLDTLVGFFLVGKIPTGSRDPFGLRRAAAALVQATLDQDLSYPLDGLIQHSARLYREQGIAGGEEGLARLVPFIEERLRYVGQEVHGFRYDAINAALAVGWADLRDAFRRAEALHHIRGQEDFEALSLSYRRIKNILAGQPTSPLEEGRLRCSEEKALLRALHEVEERAAPSLRAGDYSEALRTLATLRSPLDRFFEKVLVMDPDATIRANRLALLERISTLFMKIGDLAEMVLEGEGAGEPARRGRRG